MKATQAKLQDNENAFKHLFGPALLKRLSDSLVAVYPSFNQKRFLKLMPELEPLEMKPRVRFLRAEMQKLLPPDYVSALKILRQSAASGKIDGFDLWPYTDFVQTYGLDHLQASLDALQEFTKLFTSEWAVRPFIKLYPEETLKYLQDCARSPDMHVRRWASEGTRPRLPWGERLQDFVRDPSPTLPILEQLKYDPELYVRKSVSNHLNDIAKDHPTRVIKLLNEWKRAAEDDQKGLHADSIDWIIRRSLRTLIKDGDAGALKLIGVSQKTQIELLNFSVHQKKIRMGERIDFEIEIRSVSSKPQKLVLDYIIHFVKANQSTAPKVFKLKTFELEAKGSIQIIKSHSFKKITTRTYYSGLHALELQINGLSVGKRKWKLEA